MRVWYIKYIFDIITSLILAVNKTRIGSLGLDWTVDRIGLWIGSKSRGTSFLLGTRRAVHQRGYGLWLLIFKMANNTVNQGQIKSEEIVYSRFIKTPWG